MKVSREFCPAFGVFASAMFTPRTTNSSNDKALELLSAS